MIDTVLLGLTTLSRRRGIVVRLLVAGPVALTLTLWHTRQVLVPITLVCLFCLVSVWVMVTLRLAPLDVAGLMTSMISGTVMDGPVD